MTSNMPSRIQQLKQFINDDPEDPFNYYALALEYIKTDEKQALQILENVIINHKNYIPTYYQLAQLYERTAQKEKAIQTCNEGMVIARRQNDMKTFRELSAALDLLEDEKA